MSDKREIVQREISGVYTGAPLPAPATRDKRQIAKTVDTASYAVQAAEHVHLEAQRAATNLRMYAVGIYATAAERMAQIQQCASDDARDYVEPFVMEQAIQLANDLTRLGTAAVDTFQRTAGQNYLPPPKKSWFQR
jgi:hypothetical protein